MEQIYQILKIKVEYHLQVWYLMAILHMKMIFKEKFHNRTLINSFLQYTQRNI